MKEKEIILKSLSKVLPEDLESDILKRVKIHKNKVHFIPIKYRVLNSFLQSLNIKFGNLLESMINEICKEQDHLQVMPLSGQYTYYNLTKSTNNLIESYMNKCEQENLAGKEFPNLLKEGQKLQFRDEETTKFRKDLDLYVLNKETNTYHYIEIKYNDDHDTGKFENINRKFMKTALGIYKLEQEKQTDQIQFYPMLYYFNDDIRYHSPFLREGVDVIRGKQLFEKLDITNLSYGELETEFDRLTYSLESRFDEIKNRIFEIVSKHTNENRMA